MAEEEDKSSKTEEPSERKLSKAKEKGNVPKSREVNNFAMLLAIVLTLFTTFPMMLSDILEIYGGILQSAGVTRLDEKASLGNYLMLITEKSLIALIPTALVLMIFAYFGGFAQTGPIWSIEPIKPKMSKISLIKGFERMFSMRSLMEFLKSLIKMLVLGAALYFVLYINRENFMLLVDKTIMDTVVTVQIVLAEMLLAAIIIAFVLAVIDFAFQRSQHMKDNRMTRRELKDEFKETEGDPHIKSRQRQIRLERARARMMQELPSADVVVTNPTHYAVALRYDKAKEQAPRVIAKGVDFVALKIREKAQDLDIPLYEDPPLARQLYADVEVEDEIPMELYEAVAQVVAFIYNLNPAKRKENAVS